MSEIMSSTIKQVSDDYIEYIYFIDLFMLQTGASLQDTVALFLNKSFNRNVDIYSIDRAFRIKKLEDTQFLEDMLEVLLDDNYFDIYDDIIVSNVLPQKVIDKYYDIEKCVLRKSDILDIQYFQQYNLKLSGEEYINSISQAHDNRRLEQRRYQKEERGEICYCYRPIRTQKELNIDEIACMMSNECYCHIHFTEGHIDYSCCSNEFWKCKNFLQQENESGNLVSDLENKLFSNNYIQRYLYKNGFIIEGHNQGMAIPPIMKSDEVEPLVINADNNLNSIEQQLADALAKIDKLEQSQADGSFAMGTPTVAHGEPMTNEQLVEALTAANAKIKQQEQDIKKLNDRLNDQADKHLYDWQAMDKNQYPPELHLAMEIWKEYYQADVIKHITQFDSGRFNRISTKLNLSKGNLKDRIRTLLTPLESKLKAPLLAKSLKVIDIIYTDKLEQD